MKTAVIGFSGSGKSTLARRLGQLYKAEVLHLDSVHFLPGWAERDSEDEKQIVEDFLDNHNAWVIDGNYGKLSYERRMREADRIIMMLFGRLDCFRRVVKRFHTYKNSTRPDMADGCREKLDMEFALWVLFGGRKKAALDRLRKLRRDYPDKVVVLKNQRELDDFCKATGL